MFYPWKQIKNNLEILWLLRENDNIKNWFKLRRDFSKVKIQGLKEKVIEL